MSNELRIKLDRFTDTGLTLLGRVYTALGVQLGSDVAMTEVDDACYIGDYALGSVPDGSYGVSFETATEVYGTGSLFVKGGVEVSQEKLFKPTTDVEATLTGISAQATLARKHLTNRDKIDTAAKTLTRYDDDDTTPLVVFDLLDADGLPSATFPTEKIPQ